ncbi:MAG TPA: UvrD-helicase domain-containing protein [Euzebyales bacterium]|nr:UvrD-helicase domain-containing protein [Euzebyales bacterium]
MTDQTELQREQRHVDRAYARLEVLRRRAAERSAGVLAQGRGGTHQARHDRDALVRSTLHRLDQIDAAEYGLVFGRIDERDGDAWHIGRLGISDEGYEPLVVDWRAPIAAAFYRATPLEPMGLRRRRHVHMRQRRVVGLDDELLDVDAARDGDDSLVGEAALLAALARPRGDRMGDIVATIQREQDEVIRAPLDGVTVVQGGPGTGKTAVALHRVAYLLYTNRERIAHSGVLIIGPSARFLRYIGDVLPGLGERSVRMARVVDLLGEDLVTLDESPALQRIKGDARMATVLDRLARRWPWSRVRDDDWDDLPGTMLRVLLSDHDLLRRVAGDVLPADAIATLAGTVRDGWTEADIALLDALLVTVERRRPKRERGRDEERRIAETIDTLDVDHGRRAEVRRLLRRQIQPDVTGDDDVYGHIVVDEAQELSPMQWRMLVRRCPSGSMTVVGDLDQAMSATALHDWEELAPRLPGRLSVHELTVNYRTPVEIMAHVEQQTAITGIRYHPPQSVRSSGREPQIVPVTVDGVGQAVHEALAAVAEEPGTVAVIAATTLTDLVASAIDDEVPVVTARQAKGLEFDAVVLVGPSQIAEEASGGAALYVALTRATRDLTVLDVKEPA